MLGSAFEGKNPISRMTSDKRSCQRTPATWFKSVKCSNNDKSVATSFSEFWSRDDIMSDGLLSMQSAMETNVIVDYSCNNNNNKKTFTKLQQSAFNQTDCNLSDCFCLKLWWFLLLLLFLLLLWLQHYTSNTLLMESTYDSFDKRKTKQMILLMNLYNSLNTKFISCTICLLLRYYIKTFLWILPKPYIDMTKHMLKNLIRHNLPKILISVRILKDFYYHSATLKWPQFA